MASENRDMKRSGIALELDRSAIRPARSGEDQEQEKNEPGSHDLYDTIVPRKSIG